MRWVAWQSLTVATVFSVACGSGGGGGGAGDTTTDAAVVDMACVPSCEGRWCGHDDGCGGTCKTCPENAECDEAKWSCACPGPWCGDTCCLDGQACGAGETCEGCGKQCSGKWCGDDDGCGGRCKRCPTNAACDEAQWGCTCPGPWCGDTCCLDGQSCGSGDTCEGCARQCAGKVCGDDGCGSVCGTCTNPCTGEPDNSVCVDGLCTTPCCPDCAGKACGADNGCGVACGPADGIAPCDDGNPCTDDACDAVIGCVTSSRDDGECGPGSCDGTTWTPPPTCRAGVCQPGTPEACTSPNACNAAECNGQLGCVLHPVDDGTRCGDGACEGSKAWTKPRTCESGTCGPAEPALACDDGDPCTKDGCDPKTGCSHTPEKDGSECGAATCTAGGGYVAPRRCKAAVCGPAPEAVSCDDGLACTVDSCDPLKGCSHLAVDGDCDDGFACTTDVCDPLAGCVSTPEDSACTDSDPCTDDVCSPSDGCVHPLNAAPCDDGDPCTVGDACSQGACAPGPAPPDQWQISTTPMVRGHGLADGGLAFYGNGSHLRLGPDGAVVAGWTGGPAATTAFLTLSSGTTVIATMEMAAAKMQLRAFNGSGVGLWTQEYTAANPGPFAYLSVNVMAEGPQGDIFAGGFNRDGGENGNYRWRAARLTAAGGDVWMHLYPLPATGHVTGLAPQPDGGVLVSGTLFFQNGQHAVVRYDAVGGVVSTRSDLPSSPFGMIAAEGGGAWVALHTGILQRLRADGTTAHQASLGQWISSASVPMARTPGGGVGVFLATGPSGAVKTDIVLLRFDAAANLLGSTRLDPGEHDSPLAASTGAAGRLLAGIRTGKACWDPPCDPVFQSIVGLRIGAWGVLGCEADGVCAGLAPADCDDHDPCTRDGCDPITGCTHDAWPGGTPCGDGFVCNSGTCQ
ncbi:MAG: hypothetical protein FJ087_05140 [Deltaproteobacteria bacterium]|nr:hypothetical protein [Deltaproteobacteria bacterium]